MVNVLQIVKEYLGNHSLFNEQLPLNADRFRVTVCYLTGTDDGKNQLESKVHRVIYLDYADKKVQWYRPSVVRKVREIIEEEKIDVVNCHRHRATLVGIVSACLSRQKPQVFSTVHGFERKIKFRRKVIDFFFFKKLNGFITVADALKLYVLQENWGVSSDQVLSIQNGSNFERFKLAEGKAVVRKELFPEILEGFWFGTVGRLVPVKNHERLIQAFAKVVVCQPDAQLLIAGCGHLQERLKELAVSLNVADRVHFLGFRGDIHRVLKTFDGFVIPSLREGMPMALLEAMGAGLPVIGARVGGIMEILSDCQSGCMVNPSDVDELAAAMLALAKTPAARLEEMGRISRQHALVDFSAARMVAQYEELFARAASVRN